METINCFINDLIDYLNRNIVLCSKYMFSISEYMNVLCWLFLFFQKDLLCFFVQFCILWLLTVIVSHRFCRRDFWRLYRLSLISLRCIYFSLILSYKNSVDYKNFRGLNRCLSYVRVYFKVVQKFIFNCFKRILKVLLRFLDLVCFEKKKKFFFQPPEWDIKR